MNFEHLDLFSGLGGFAIAAGHAGFRTVAFCESDPRCRDFLEKRWGLPVEPDIRQLDGRKYAGISLLTGGPPCQPASRAGKQGGEKDDRWLWGEALRVLGETKPDCVLFENPPGILDVGIDGILSEMGRLGYETQCFDIPACAVDSPQLRHRIWIVGFLAHTRHDAVRSEHRKQLHYNHSGFGQSVEGGPLADTRCERSGEIKQEWGSAGRTADRRDSADELAHTGSAGHEKRGVLTGIRSGEECADSRQTSDMGTQSLVADTERERREQRGEQSTGQPARNGRARLAGDSQSYWQNAIWVPCADGKLRRAPDDSFDLVDGLHRSILGALGNSIVPQVASEILRAIHKTLVSNK